MELPDLYPMVFKRKSIRKFDRILSISIEELDILKAKLKEIKTLVDDIKVQFVIVDRKQTTAKRGEYCLLMYSEEKPYYLLNVGYMLEQVDLFLASCNIGVCWYGVAKPQEQILNGLKYVIMLAFGKSKSSDFRKNISEFKRKDERIIWQGDCFLDIAKVVRIAPSGCNLQPWRIFCTVNEIKVYKYSNTKSFPTKKLAFYFETDFSLIDMGICLCYLEISLQYNGYFFEKELNPDNDSIEELVEIVRYQIN
jgi:nitroreductase